jgi:CubicO group peptidase (beta-lactamase class C family)
MRFLFTFLMLCGALPGLAQSLPERLDALVTAYHQLGRFNGTVLVARRGEVLLEKGYGLQDAARHIPNDAHSMFRYYSITKTMTATVVLKLIEEGRLTAQTPLSTFFPDFPDGAAITITHLLSHTAGIYEFTRGHTMPDQTAASMVAFLSKQPLDFRPGTDWGYSNSGYWLLGLIIEQVTGKRYEDAVQQYVFQPAGMRHSGFDFKTLKSRHKAIGYATLSKAGQQPSEVYDPPGPYAAGAVHGTAGDLYRYYRALQSGKLLRPSSLALAYQPVMNNYGLGWVTDSIAGQRVIGHSGGAAGFRSNFAQVLEADICVVLLSNVEQNVMWLNTQLLAAALDQPYRIPFQVEVAPSAMREFEGVYALGPDLALYVKEAGGQLVAQASGQPPVHPFAQSATRFYVEEIDGFLEFLPGPAGRSDTLLVDRQGRQMKSPRLPAAWGIVGSATPHGWEGPDVLLTEVPGESGHFTASAVALQAGELKFRRNNEWMVNLGAGALPASLVPDGGNIPANAGTYDVHLDLRGGKAVFLLVRLN